jgi:energy-coupling factor transport system substrate-specific component
LQLTTTRANAIENTALAVVSAAGLVAFALPFLLAVAPGSAEGTQRAVDAAFLLGFVVAGALLVAIGELLRTAEDGGLSRAVALLGVLVAIDATLRLIPSFFGASPIFALIVLVGYVYGSRFGFVMGALTLLLSAAITAGVGPWLPFQMLCAGWVGLAAGWLPRQNSRIPDLAVLVVFGVLAGFAYGALMNLYAWPFAAPGVSSSVGLYWVPSLSPRESVERYVKFYLATSMLHDATRAFANAALLLVAGAPVLRILHRFRSRSSWATTEAT